jgi:tetratricopeptide (TPR) repeat protein
VALKGDKATAHNNLGLSYFEKEDFEEALNEFTKSIQLEQHSFHYNNRGLAYYHIGKLEDAKKDYDDAIVKNPDDPFFYFNRGNVFLNQG